jgi:predicted membrane-bound mannosyltransferase
MNKHVILSGALVMTAIGLMGFGAGVHIYTANALVLYAIYWAIELNGPKPKK